MQVIIDAFVHTALQFAALFGVFLVGGISLTLISKWTNLVFQRFIYPKFGLYAFGSIGVPFHELCHAIFCKLFTHEIQSIKWFDPQGKGGAYGAVTHSYSPTNLYQRIGHFFIGLGPTLLAPIALAGLFVWLVPGARGFDPFASATTSEVITHFSQALFRASNFHAYGFYFFIYLAICISSQMELSSEDLAQVKLGILPILIPLLLFNLIAGTMGAHWHLHVIGWGWKLMIFSGCLFGFAAAIALLNLGICAVIFHAINSVTGHK